jgi:hypothetical protein
MHKGYKCLDRSTGRIYIYHDVVFDETVFPYATPGVTVDINTLEQSISFPSSEPAMNAHVRNYVMSYLSTDVPVTGIDPSLQVPTPSLSSSVDPVIDVHVHVTPPETPTSPA